MDVLSTGASSPFFAPFLPPLPAEPLPGEAFPPAPFLSPLASLAPPLASLPPAPPGAAAPPAAAALAVGSISAFACSPVSYKGEKSNMSVFKA